MHGLFRPLGVAYGSLAGAGMMFGLSSLFAMPPAYGRRSHPARPPVPLGGERSAAVGTSSSNPISGTPAGAVGWPSGYAAACQAANRQSVGWGKRVSDRV